jgi:predicted transcriptional regulator
MDVPLTPAQETALIQLAADTGRQAEELVQEAVDRMLAYNRWFNEQVKVGLDQIERGEFVSHEEVGKRIERVFRA